MSLSALVRLYRVTNWNGLSDGKNMKHACELAILERLQEVVIESAFPA